MSAPVKIQAAIFCGGKHDSPVSLIVPLGNRRRRQYDDYAEGYARGKGWTTRDASMSDMLARAMGTGGPLVNDWRCPECSKAGAS